MTQSPNFGERRGGLTQRLVILHYTAMQTLDEAVQRLCDPAHQVSAHYVISAQGEIVALVDEAHRAWHAGQSRWGSLTDVNSASIGIELCNPGNCPFAEPQLGALEGLLADLLARYAIAPKGVLAHSDISPGRKIDPGPRFPWQRLARQNLSIWPEAFEPGDFEEDARAFGYTSGDEITLKAFRSRFRPHHAGPLDTTDQALMADLAKRFPVDL